MRTTIHGYHDGVSYVVIADDAADADPVTGVIVHGAPQVAAALDTAAGQGVPITPTGPYQTAGLDTVDGVLAAALATTQVTSVEGDVPDWYDIEDDPTVVY